jgi:hypothetical protein
LKSQLKSQETLENQIKKVLTHDLLNKKWQKLINLDSHPMEGHCYVASEAAYHLYGKKNGFLPHVLSGPNWTHWFLKHKDGRIIDITREQFKNTTIDYRIAKRCPFLTAHPSNRCQEVFRRLSTSP